MYISSGCTRGIDFNIIHENENIAIIPAEDAKHRISFENYKNAVLSFARQVMDYYHASPPRQFENDFDKNGYRAFVTEWYSLYDKAVSIADTIPTVSSITFEDYAVCPEEEIISIDKGGISLKSSGFINFKECAYNFKQTEGGSGRCIGERNITDLSFTFFTSPQPIMIKSIKKKAVFCFHHFQKQILKYGYRTRDIS